MLNDSIYCSMMKNALGFIVLENARSQPSLILDAMASKTQIFAFKKQMFNSELVSYEFVYVYEDIVKLVKGITSYIEGSLPSLTEEGYSYAQKNSLKNIGPQIIEAYQKVSKGE